MSEIRTDFDEAYYYRIDECRCDFCNKIYDAEELKRVLWVDRWDITNCITYSKESDKYYIWDECDDFFYSGNILEINFCPKCGRKLITKD